MHRALTYELTASALVSPLAANSIGHRYVRLNASHQDLRGRGGPGVSSSPRRPCDPSAALMVPPPSVSFPEQLQSHPCPACPAAPLCFAHAIPLGCNTLPRLFARLTNPFKLHPSICCLQKAFLKLLSPHLGTPRCAAPEHCRLGALALVSVCVSLLSPSVSSVPSPGACSVFAEPILSLCLAP